MTDAIASVMDLQTPELRRRDLMELEPLLCDSLRAVLPFAAHALYFPQEDVLPAAEWVAGERKVLLPLRRGGRLLGVFMMSGVNGRQARPLLPALPAIATLALDKLAWHRASLLDPVTGLLRSRVLLERMAREADGARASLHVMPDAGDDAAANQEQADRPNDLHRLCTGMICLRCNNFSDILQREGHAFGDDMMRRLAEALMQELPADVSVARSGPREFLLLLPMSGRATCRRTAEAALGRMRALVFQDAVTRQPVAPRLVGGYAVYPQDMQGVELALPMFEQSRILLSRARLAAHVAADRLRVAQAPDEPPVMDVSRILHQGGAVREVLPPNRLRITLGRQAGAREGMRFTVWNGAARREQDRDAAYRGEISLLDVQETCSIAEIRHPGDPAWPPQRGDSLILLPDGDASQDGAQLPLRTDPLTGLLCHDDFLRALASERERRTAFALAVLRVAPQTDAALSAAQVEQLLPEIVGERRALAQAAGMEDSLPGGRYGSHCLIFLHATADMDALRELYASLASRMAERRLDLATGIAAYPLLHFDRAEMLACALKALDCALLLPAPRVSQCDSLAFNVSADRRYSLGDVFGAVEEYRLALLADDGNATAWNSLGVCMAAAGQTGQARRYFLEAQKRAPQDASVAYNMGTLCQTLHETRAAARQFNLCIRLDPNHLYAHIRLGQIAEQGGRRKLACQYYQQAAALEAALPDSCLARRHLARMALLQKRGAEARELLHDALLKNPRDAASLRMLAGLYLDGGEDPAMAEMLARKSVCLQPVPQGWRLLARALRALGREDDALRTERMANGSVPVPNGLAQDEEESSNT